MSLLHPGAIGEIIHRTDGHLVSCSHHISSVGKGDIVVNSLHPGSTHSKICQSAPLSAAEACSSVASTALLAHPCEEPRGQFIWHDLHLVDWRTEDIQQGLAL